MSFWLQDKENDSRHGLAVDIYSDGIRLAIIEEGTRFKNSTWTCFEQFRYSEPGVLETPELKRVLRLVFRKLEHSGLLTLQQKYPGSQLSFTCLTMSSPLTHTVVRRVKLVGRRPKYTSSSIIKKLTQQENGRNVAPIITKLGLITLCGPVFTVKNRYHQTVVVIKNDVWEELFSTFKTFAPDLGVEVDTFMSVYFRSLNKLPHETNNIYLLDITPWTAESCRVSDGVLNSYMDGPYGIHKLTNLIHEETSLPYNEILNMMRDNDIDPFKTLNKSKREIITKLINRYEWDLAALMARVDDGSTPSSVFLHTDPRYLHFLRHRLRAALNYIGKETSIMPLTEELFNKGTDEVVTGKLWSSLFPQVSLRNKFKENMLK